MAKMSERVRRLVGLENLLVKARRRHRECEREHGDTDDMQAGRYRLLIQRVSDEIHDTDRADLEEYLKYVEDTLLARLSHKVEEVKHEMLKAAKRVVQQKAHLTELRSEYTDGLERIRSVRERLGLDPFRPVDAKFGLTHPPPGTDRSSREAYDLVQEYLKS